MADILLVDDEPEIMATTKIVLERAGYRVIEAESGAECLEKLKKKQPDLILLDVMLPDESGWDVCRKIKKDGKTRDIPVVMFTVR
ncbi:MAG: response regulator, partial [Candidatus Hydrothermarchaeales archaeon]